MMMMTRDDNADAEEERATGPCQAFYIALPTNFTSYQLASYFLHTQEMISTR